MKKILFLDRVHPLIREELTGAGFQCDDGITLTRQEVMGQISLYRGVILRSRIPFDRELLSGATSLRWIGRVGAGMEGIDTEEAGKLGIACLNSPEGNRDAVGEHTLGMLLSLLNHLNRADREVRMGKWEREGNRGTEIMGKTIGIVGYGNMGSAFARRLTGFDAEVISWDKYKRDYSDGNTRETTMEELFERADILSLHIPLTPETAGMVDHNYLYLFRKDIRLLNTSRGPIVKTAALAEAIQQGKVLGAALDVLEYEDSSFEKLTGAMPPEMQYLINSDKVLLTPHIAGWTLESNIKLAKTLVTKILELESNI